MRKAIFLNFPTHGCINSLLATASELVKRGDKIIYYCTEEFRNKIEQTGAEFRPYSGFIKEFYMRDSDLFKALKLNIDMTIDKMEHNLENIRKENPDYIIHDSLCTWGKHIAKILKLPAINLMHSFPVTASSVELNQDTAALLFKVGFYKIINRFKSNSPHKILKKKFDIDLSMGDILVNQEDLNIVYTSKHMEPNIYQSKKNYFFAGPSLFFKNEQNDFPFDKLKGKKVVYISLGTLLSNNFSFYMKCIKAFSNKEFYIVISIGFDVDIKALGKIPDNFIIKQSVPQQKLLKFVDVFITHAGMNSVNEAICFGVPMLMIPLTFEEKMIARRVKGLGIGLEMNMNGISPKKLYESTKKLNSDAMYMDQVVKYRKIFSEEEKTSHLKAADEILSYIDQQ